jgi:hypothetical protein
VEEVLKLGLNGDQTEVRIMTYQVEVMTSAVDVTFVL